MSDQDTSLPTRTEAAGDIDVFVSDATTPTQKLKVNADGSIDTNSTPTVGSKMIVTDGTDDMGVNVDGSINVVATATDLDIRNLVFATDKADVSGSTVTVTATQLDVDNLNATDDAVQAHLFDETGTAYSPANPLAVSFTSDQQGDEVCDYNTSAAVASDATVNHDYTVTLAKTFLAEDAWVSGSGKIKVEILINAVTVFVGFNSTSNPNVSIPMSKICKGLATEVIRMTITNRENQAQDVYSTLTGIEV